MENIINELVRIETVAKDTMLSIDASRKFLPKRIQEACEKIQMEIDEEFKAKRTENENRCFQESEEAVTHIRVKAQTQFSNLEDEYYRNHEALEQEIFQSIVKEV